jgi:hypothetical protein
MAVLLELMGCHPGYAAGRPSRNTEIRGAWRCCAQGIRRIILVTSAQHMRSVPFLKSELHRIHPPITLTQDEWQRISHPDQPRHVNLLRIRAALPTCR